jgi:hypothetical protein
MAHLQNHRAARAVSKPDRLIAKSLMGVEMTQAIVQAERAAPRGEGH